MIGEAAGDWPIRHIKHSLIMVLKQIRLNLRPLNGKAACDWLSSKLEKVVLDL